MIEIKEAKSLLQSRRLILGFGHKRRHGKDECAKAATEFLQECGYLVHEDAFAFSLKQAAMSVFGLSLEQVYGDQKGIMDTFWGTTPRDILQRMGTESMRNVFGEDIWVRTLVRRALTDPRTSVIVSDVRFPNEAAAIHDLGGYLIRVDRPTGLVPPPSCPEEDSHASEIALDYFRDWDFAIMNDKTLPDLRAAVRDLVRSIIAIISLEK